MIGGYTPSARSFDALIFGYYEGDDQLIYVARTRNGFTPRSRVDLFARLASARNADLSFSNLPEPKEGRWGQGLTAAKMAGAAGSSLSLSDSSSSLSGRPITISVIRALSPARGQEAARCNRRALAEEAAPARHGMDFWGALTPTYGRSRRKR